MWHYGNLEWTETATSLLEAYQMYSDSLCGSCGQSAFHALEVGNTREFAADSVICLGCNVREVWQSQNEHPPKGTRLYVKNMMGGDDG